MFYISLSAANDHGVLKNSTEYTVVYFVQTVLVSATSPSRSTYKNQSGCKNIAKNFLVSSRALS